MPFRKIDINNITQDITQGGQTTQEQTPITPLTLSSEPKEQGFIASLGEMAKLGTGVKLLEETAKAAASPITQQALQDIQEVRRQMIDNTTSLVNLIRNTQDEQAKQRLTNILNEQISLINEMTKTAGETEQETQTSLGKIAEATIDPLLTIGTLGTGSIGAGLADKLIAKTTSKMGATLGEHLLKPALKSTELALTGAAFKAAHNLGEDKPIDEGLIGAGAISGAIPLLGKGLSLTKSVLTKGIKTTAQLFTDKDALSVAFSRPKVVENAIKYLEKNEKQPFLELARETAYRLEKAHDNAVKAFGEIWSAIPKDKLFKVNLGLPEVSKIAEKFGVILKQNKETGEIVISNKSDILFFPARAVEFLTEIVNKLTSPQKIDALAIKNLKQSLSAGISYVGKEHQAKRKWDMLITELNKELDKKIEQAIPEMIEANKNYAKVEKVYSLFKKRLIRKVERDEAGNIIKVIPRKESETMLANLLNVNKGQLRNEFWELEELTGLDIFDRAVILKAAQDLGANVSFLKAAVAKGGIGLILSALGGAAGFSVGGGIGGALAALTALGLASPKIAGLVARKAGQTQKVIHQKMPEFLKNLIEKAGGGKFENIPPKLE